MAKTTLLETQQITTTLIPINETLSVYGVSFYPAPFKFEVGETYTVVWNGTEYTCEAYDGGTLMLGTTYVGNASGFGMQGDPTQGFIIASNDMAVVVMSLVDTNAGTSGTHSVGVYQEDKQYAIYGSTLKAIANSIRIMTGTSDKLTPSAMPAAVESISGGGGNVSDDYVTVTFMNGDVELFSRLVMKGDHCPDPVDQNRITEPEKDSTVSTVYTYDHGWSLTNGGSASSSALSNVTEDRTVYAAYKSEPRYYTIIFYDSDGVTELNKQDYAYGSDIVYLPEKDGHTLTGWEPALTTVTGDASYIAQWQETVTLAGASWSRISEISTAGEAANYFAVGDCKPVQLNGTFLDETIDGIYYAYIVHFDASAIIFGAFKNANMVNIHFAGPSGDGYNIHVDGSGSSPQGFAIYKNSKLRYQLGNTNETTASLTGNAAESVLSNPRSGSLLACFPDELRANMKTTVYYSHITASSTSGIAYSDYLVIPSEYNYTGSFTGSKPTYTNEPRVHYSYYKNGGDPPKYTHNNPSKTGGVWLQHHKGQDTGSFCYINWLAPGPSIYEASSSTTKKQGVAPVFSV